MCLQVAADPCQLFLGQTVLKIPDFLLLSTEDDIVHITVIKGIVVPLEFSAPVARRLKVVQVCRRQTRLPLTVIGLMIPHDGSYRNHALHLIQPGEECCPLRTILAVVHEVAKAGKKRGICVACPRKMCKLLPIRIVARLAVGKKKHLIRCISSRGIEFLPARRPVIRLNAIAILRPRYQPVDLRRILIHRHTIIGKRCIVHRDAPDFLRVLRPYLDHLIHPVCIGLPHEDTAAPGIRGDDLPQAFDIESIGKGMQTLPAQPLHTGKLPERRTACSGCPRRYRRLDKRTARKRLFPFHQLLPLSYIKESLIHLRNHTSLTRAPPAYSRMRVLPP